MEEVTSNISVMSFITDSTFTAGIVPTTNVNPKANPCLAHYITKKQDNMLEC